jgi:hypothetical protein
MRRAARTMRDWPPVARWLVAELIPFGCLFLGLLLTQLGVSPAGYLLGFLGGTLLTVWYLNWVQDTHGAWALPLILLMLAATIGGYAVTGHIIVYHGYYTRVPYVVTPAYWQAFGGLLAALAVTVALAVVNGERHRGRYSYMVGISQQAR